MPVNIWWFVIEAKKAMSEEPWLVNSAAFSLLRAAVLTCLTCSCVSCVLDVLVLTTP